MLNNIKSLRFAVILLALVLLVVIICQIRHSFRTTEYRKKHEKRHKYTEDFLVKMHPEEFEEIKINSSTDE